MNKLVQDALDAIAYAKLPGLVSVMICDKEIFTGIKMIISPLELFDNSYDFEDVRIDGKPVTDAIVRTGGWKVNNGTLTPDANRWNYILMGDSTAHDYTFSMRVRRNKGSGQIQLRVRDNGKEGDNTTSCTNLSST